MWLHSLKVAQLLRSAACLHTNQSRSYLNHLVFSIILWRVFLAIVVLESQQYIPFCCCWCTHSCEQHKSVQCYHGKAAVGSFCMAVDRYFLLLFFLASLVLQYFPDYLIRGSIFGGKKIIEHKMCLDFLYNFCMKHLSL